MNQMAFERIFIIMFENEAQSAVMQNPYMRDLVANGVQLSNYFGVTHPSQPNYIASVAGSTCGVMDDSTYDIEGQSIIDLLEAKDMSWRAYMVGDTVNKGTVEGGRYNHYSLLRTIEENFQLGTLGRNDAKADWFTFLLARDQQQSFNWSRHSQKTPEGVRNFHPDSTTVDCP